MNNNIFLADINNAKPNKNAQYKKNMLSLNNVLLLMSSTDNIVVPRQSPQWSFFDYVNGSDSNVDPYYVLPDFTEDWIGLKTLQQQKKLILVTVPCGHQNIPRDQCKQYYDMYTRPLLNNTL